MRDIETAEAPAHTVNEEHHDTPDNGESSNEKVGEARVFLIRGDKKFVRGLGFHAPAGKRVQALRVTFGKKKSTSISLQKTDFFVQYRRAVKLLADFFKVPPDDALRKQMEQTVGDFMDYYGLTTQTRLLQHKYGTALIDNVAVQLDHKPQSFEARQSKAEDNSAADADAKLRRRDPMWADGRVRGITFRPRTGVQGTAIHVRPQRGKAKTFSLERTSFSVQYKRAINCMADAIALAEDDPVRAQMLASGPAFLKHYKLATVAITIPDAVVMPESDETEPS
jgi:hypothetical protein